MVEHWHLPHFMSWSKLKGDDFDAEFRKRMASFPDDLVQAIGNRDSMDHKAAVQFTAVYAHWVRSHAAHLSAGNLAVAVDRALAPHTAKIRDGLVGSLQTKEAKTRLMAALTLLSLDEKHLKAIEILQASASSPDAELVSKTCECIGLAHLTSPEAFEYLRCALNHADKTVRQAAAVAVINMGPAASKMAPALITFLETGKEVEGTNQAPFTISIPQFGNLALIALESLKEHARPAIPTLLARFAKADPKDQTLMLACLANTGQKDAACLAIVRKLIQSEDIDLQLAAGCTLLHLIPGDQEGAKLLKKALGAEATRKNALNICRKLGPPSPEIVAVLTSMLDNKTETIRLDATLALARIGPHASEAVPALEKLLAKEEDGITHTFQSTRAAAAALAMIGGNKAAAALLRVADSNVSGARYAVNCLTDLGAALPPTAPAVLVRIIKGNDGPKVEAAIALSNLGERARPVRKEMEGLLETAEVGWILDTALRRIPE